MSEVLPLNYSQIPNLLLKSNPGILSHGTLHGLERECLRITPDGKLCTNPHPKMLGSSLTNPAITTDFSESQIEFTTKPYSSIIDALGELEDLQNFVCTSLDGELLWPMSMPAWLPSKESDIPLAQYGTSRQGAVKTIYRRGLGHRYGRRMQTISGIHYNFSLGEGLLNYLAESTNTTSKNNAIINNQNFKNNIYFHMIRNFKRRAACIPYLFGASCAMDQSFFSDSENIPSRLQQHGSRTWFNPTATSLRLSGIGYTNPNQSNISISYNQIEHYIAGMDKALQTHIPDYEMFSVKDKQQLNANLLQIENEHYASIRPKPNLNGFTSSLDALKQNGVQYLEVRGLDLNPFVPVAVDAERLAFVHLLLLDSLFSPSDILQEKESEQLEQDFQLAIWEGRKTDVRLFNQKNIAQAGNDLCDKMEILSSLLDQETNSTLYSKALKLARSRFNDSTTTPSAILLAEIRNSSEMLELGISKAMDHCRYFGRHLLEPKRDQEIQELIADSIIKQTEIEQNENK